jgi:hypothetical protein
MGVREGCARNLAHGRARRVQLRDEATRALKSSRVGHVAAEFERLANVLPRRGCGNPALITYPAPCRSQRDDTTAPQANRQPKSERTRLSLLEDSSPHRKTGETEAE